MVADALQQGQTRPDPERQRGDREYTGLPGAAVDGELGWRGASTASSCAVCAPHPTKVLDGRCTKTGMGSAPPNTMLRSKGGVRPEGALFVVLSPDCILESLGVFKQAQDFPRDVDVLVGGRVRASGFLKLST